MPGAGYADSGGRSDISSAGGLRTGIRISCRIKFIHVLMKSIGDIERLSAEELERNAGKLMTEVPEGLEDRLLAGMAVSGCQDDADAPSRRRKILWVSSIAGVAAAAAVVLAVVPERGGRLEDTFDDPMLAYAEVEKAFAYISDRIRPGVEKIGEASRMLEHSGEMFERVSGNSNNDR